MFWSDILDVGRFVPLDRGEGEPDEFDTKRYKAKGVTLLSGHVLIRLICSYRSVS
jgi:hypothetical protein